MEKKIIVRLAVACFIAAAVSPVAQAQSGSRGGGGVSQYQLHQQRLQQQQVQQQRQAAARREAARRAAVRRQQQASRAAAAKQRDGVVVVELFTSQGCSSCPSADAALQQIVDVAERRELNVYGLSFHVDYWNRLGWDDPYSHKDFTTRQTTYAAKQQGNQVYTPQMIVNGTIEFLGSDKSKAHAAISSALKETPETTVDLTVDRTESGVVRVSYRLAGAVNGNALNVAIIQDPPSNSVASGENHGRQLKHVNVVRAFKVIVPDSDSGTVDVQLPDDFDSSLGYEVVAYAQNKSSYAIVGANAVPVPAQPKTTDTTTSLSALR